MSALAVEASARRPRPRRVQMLARFELPPGVTLEAAIEALTGVVGRVEYQADTLPRTWGRAMLPDPRSLDTKGNPL